MIVDARHLFLSDTAASKDPLVWVSSYSTTITAPRHRQSLLLSHQSMPSAKEDGRRGNKIVDKMTPLRILFATVLLFFLGTSAMRVLEVQEQQTYTPMTLMHKQQANWQASARSPPRMDMASDTEDQGQASFASSLKESTMGQDVLNALDESVANTVDTEPVDRLLVHNGQLSLQSWKGELLTMAQKVEALVTKDNRGYVESRSSFNTGYEDRLSMNIQFRIQSEHFQKTIDSIQALAGEDMVMSVNVNSRDVTDSYIDATARADTLDASRKALRTLLERANNVQEIMEVQRELNSLTQQYESQRQRAKHLKKEADYSYLSVHLEEKLERHTAAELGWRPSRALLLAWGHMGYFCSFVGDALLYSLVWAVPLLVAYLVFSCIKKK